MINTRIILHWSGNPSKNIQRNFLSVCFLLWIWQTDKKFLFYFSLIFLHIFHLVFLLFHHLFQLTFLIGHLISLFLCFLRISIMPNNKKKAININTVDVTGSFGRYVIFSKKFLAPKSQLILFNVKIKTAERKDKMMKFMTPIRILI